MTARRGSRRPGEPTASRSPRSPTGAAAEKLVADGTVEAAIVGDPSATPFGFTVVADSIGADHAAAAARRRCRRSSCSNPDPTDEVLRYLVAIGFGVVFLMRRRLFGATIAQSVVEEKQTRVVETAHLGDPARGRCWPAR